jgi:hypothetical protein
MSDISPSPLFSMLTLVGIFFSSQRFSPKTSDHTVSRGMGAPQVPIPLAPVDVATHTVYEQYPASQMTRPSSD